MKTIVLFVLALLVGALMVGRRIFALVQPNFHPADDLLACGDVYGTEASKTQTNPANKVDVQNLGARIRYMNEVYTQSGAGTIGDVIHLPALPVGAKIIAGLSNVYFSAGNASATLALGKTGAATALKSATAITSAGSFALTTPANGADDVTLAADEQLIATNATAAIKAAQAIRFRIAYVENS